MPKKGYRQTPEHRERIGAALRGRSHTKARRRNISRALHRYHVERVKSGH